MRPMPHANDESLLLDIDQTIILVDLCMKLWARGVDTVDMAKAVSFRLGRIIPESIVANALADCWEDGR